MSTIPHPKTATVAAQEAAMSEELKSCPFCGTPAEIEVVGCSTPGMEDCGYISCGCPKCYGGDGKIFCGIHADTKEDAIAAWNRRALPPMGNVVAWSVRPLDYHSTILIGDEPAGDVSPQLAQLLADRHNAEVAALTQALTDLRREGDDMAEAIKSALPSWHVDADDATIHHGRICCELDYGDVRRLKAALRRYLPATAAPLPAPQRPTAHE